jgi:hypothetical protein
VNKEAALTRSAYQAENIPHTVTYPETLARWLLAAEADKHKDPAELAAVGERVYHRLRTHLAVLLGTNGFDALWARAMHLAQPNFRVESDTTAAEAFPTRAAQVYGLYAAVQGHDSAVIQQNLVVAFASLITLLFTFIGAELSLRFIRQVWPDLPQDVAESRADGATP